MTQGVTRARARLQEAPRWGLLISPGASGCYETDAVCNAARAIVCDVRREDGAFFAALRDMRGGFFLLRFLGRGTTMSIGRNATNCRVLWAMRWPQGQCFMDKHLWRCISDDLRCGT